MFLRGRTSHGYSTQGTFGVVLSRRGRLSIIGFTLESLERDYRKWEGRE